MSEYVESYYARSLVEPGDYPALGGKFGRIPAQFIYWRHQAAAAFDRMQST